jgi:hypothetical protein
MARIQANPKTGVVKVDGAELQLRWSLALRNHSPTGFSWGCGGSGPSQLALAILLHVTGDAGRALRYYEEFKWEFVRVWRNGMPIDVEVGVMAWLQGKEKRDAETG